MIELQLTKGKVTKVDDEDYIFLYTLGSWCFTSGYAHSDKHGRLHLIVAKRIGLIGLIDHEDRDKLNNQRDNLRAATVAQNNQNRDKFRGTSEFKGVSWYAATEKWQASIRYNSKSHHLGHFDSELEAALAYDAEAKKRFGIFAVLNFPG